MNNLISQINIAPPGGFKGIGTGLLANPAGTGIEVFTKFISSAIGLMTIVAFIWFVFTFITGAIGIISSGGDKQALESAKKKITTGIIGLVVVVASIFIVKLIGALIGVDVLNISSLFNLIQ